MLTTAQALDALLDAARMLADTETIALEQANGRVLASPIVATLDVPPADVSAMDGYAVRLADLAPDVVPGLPPGASSPGASSPGASPPGAFPLGASPPGASSFGAPLPVSQRIPAGTAPAALAPGSVARIFTGAPVPAGADTIVIQEDARTDGGTVRFAADAARAPGQWINRRGADIRAGAVILDAGTRLTAQALGLAASVGVAQVRVVRRLRVALVFTGDELRRPGETLVPGAIYNSNRYTLGGLLDNLGCVVTDYGIVADQLEATRAVLREAAAGHDLVLTSGGVSVGEEDHVKPAVEAEGRLALWKIAMKPGKPLAFGALRRFAADVNNATNSHDATSHDATNATIAGEAYFIGLPGNPVSTFVTFLLFVRPFLLRVQGVRAVAPRSLRVRADFTVRGDRRNEFLRARLNDQGGLDLFPSQSSAVLTSTVWGDGLVDNPPGQAIAPGDTVRFLPFSELLY
ncbi:molybdopterin-binding protein [Robbsia sp. Bb-Pol-6]|uniref:Molybdopterin molybdenumtransferase n=1 Tax=Robbsia betulipollinis TaxID=2981849 RepID=A0ABT3ZII9_9BURK|nr:gephyrin-like molybdotransferase Glp [Robbsia betulipollinis]MCY0386344.1 molybdopterin-binding protein [Robbsia betulipollinis]